MSSPRLRAARRLKSMPLVAALVLSVGLAFQASLCPPGMDMGSEMEMTMGVGSAGQTTGNHCPFGTSTGDDGGTTCPFSVGGTGPCGTTAPVPAIAFLTVPAAVVLELPRLFIPAAPAELFTRVHRPPPRA